ncbi:MAG: hypothetical protein RM021_017410 [Nostoc sp. EkiNYC01]|nr:hypothetical protein [Nostoc sp. EkiNYC01]
MQEEELLKQQTELNQAQYQSHAADSNANESVAAKYMGYDAELRLAKLQDASGNIFYGKPDTNGAIARGEDIRLRQGYGLPGYDAMPHHKIEQPAPLQIQKEVLDVAILFKISPQYWFYDFRLFYTYGEYIYQQDITPNRSITSEAITIEDTFLVRFGHGGFVKSFLITYYDISSISSNTYPAFKFSSPTEAIVTIDINFSPGGGVINTFCGASVDRYVGYHRVDYLEPGEQIPNDSIIEVYSSTCDAYSPASSLSYTTTVQAGEHYISVFAGYNYRYDVQSNSAGGVLYTETVSGSIKIKVETTTHTTFYVQRGRNITKIAEFSARDSLTADTYNSLVVISEYLTYTKSRLIVHLKTKTNTQIQPIVHRYFISLSGEVTEEVFSSPQIIPEIEDDWQASWTTSYLPELNSEDPCIKAVRNGFERQYTNFYKNKILVAYRTPNNIFIDSIIKNQDVTVEVKIKLYNTGENTCAITSEKRKNILLQKLIVDENIDISYIALIAVSAIYYKVGYARN